MNHDRQECHPSASYDRQVRNFCCCKFPGLWRHLERGLSFSRVILTGCGVYRPGRASLQFTGHGGFMGDGENVLKCH